MNVKFNRNYILTVTGPNFVSPLVLGLPFTLEFDVERNSYSSTNLANIRIYNLSAQHRNLLQHDQFDVSQSHILNVSLQAGYGSGPQWPLIFKGNVTRGWSVREGVNFVTTLQCLDGGAAYSNAVSNRTFSTGTSMEAVYDTLINDLVPYGVSKGAVSAAIANGTLNKGIAVSGTTLDILRDLSNNNVFIDNLAVNALLPSDAIGGTSLLINAASGLLATPVKEQTYLLFDILFEPRLSIGAMVNIQSSTAASNYNGVHKVISVHHRGIISPVVSGTAITSLGVQAGIFNEVLSAAGL